MVRIFIVTEVCHCFKCFGRGSSLKLSVELVWGGESFRFPGRSLTLQGAEVRADVLEAQTGRAAVVRGVPIRPRDCCFSGDKGLPPPSGLEVTAVL